MEVAALIISILSLIASIILAIYGAKITGKINDSNQQADLLMDAYDDYLVKKIPESRAKISFDEEGKLVFFQEFKNYMFELLEKSKCYKYLDNTYYEELKKQIIELEDYLLGKTNVSSSTELQLSINKEIDKRLSSIYSLALNKYLGKKR